MTEGVGSDKKKERDELRRKIRAYNSPGSDKFPWLTGEDKQKLEGEKIEWIRNEAIDFIEKEVPCLLDPEVVIWFKKNSKNSKYSGWCWEESLRTIADRFIDDCKPKSHDAWLSLKKDKRIDKIKSIVDASNTLLRELNGDDWPFNDPMILDVNNQLASSWNLEQKGEDGLSDYDSRFTHTQGSTERLTEILRMFTLEVERFRGVVDEKTKGSLAEQRMKQFVFTCTKQLVFEFGLRNSKPHKIIATLATIKFRDYEKNFMQDYSSDGCVSVPEVKSWLRSMKI